LLFSIYPIQETNGKPDDRILPKTCSFSVLSCVQNDIILPKQGPDEVTEGVARQGGKGTKDSKDEGGVHQGGQAQAQPKLWQEERIPNQALLMQRDGKKKGIHNTFDWVGGDRFNLAI
jgi:hypothetical protein